MKILALDSSGLVASVAIVEEDNLIAEYDIQYKKTHSQTLLPMLDEIKKMTDLDMSTLDAVALAAGPGSFTGLRIGSATAKGLGLALNIPLIEIPTLEGLAYNLYGAKGYICPIMDARRGQVYTGVYEFVRNEDLAKEGCRLEVVESQCAVPIEEIIEKLNYLENEVIFLGDGVPVFREKIGAAMKIPYHFAPAHMNRQRAASIAALGVNYYKAGKYVSAKAHAPVYLRMSQAERERKEKENQ
ncbi:MAG: tRNA (adenosine(37)-N6)-threonylcarbamoyltransferase complex dimerization subunit type 1 TsaB [Clostridiales bacterium]|nr:tRNA (adenosine(37)-N6)-threonylcarbamoyltransferase complex dimerization subunit type 1 TsaB [Clostridiales bacterium]